MTAMMHEDPPVLHRPSSRDLLRLLNTQDVCVSILMNTTPRASMGQSDSQQLRHLADEAFARLPLEDDTRAAAVVRERLALAIDEVTRRPTDEALALLVSQRETHHFHLPIRVEPRVVVDPTYATRDLMLAVQQNPPFLMLHLDSRSARLYRYNQKYLQPVLSPDFPAERPGRVRAGRDPEQLRRFLRDVDAGLSREMADSPAPLVLVGGDRVLAEFLRLSRNNVAAIQRSNRRRPRLAELEALGREAIADHVLDVEAAALDVFEARRRAERTVSGLLGAWHAAAVDSPELLLVERSFGMPARVVADGRYVEPVADPRIPGLLDDAVDELMESVVRAGGFVSLVPDGALSQHGRVALTLARS